MTAQMQRVRSYWTGCLAMICCWSTIQSRKELCITSSVNPMRGRCVWEISKHRNCSWPWVATNRGHPTEVWSIFTLPTSRDDQWTCSQWFRSLIALKSYLLRRKTVIWPLSRLWSQMMYLCISVLPPKWHTVFCWVGYWTLLTHSGSSSTSQWLQVCRSAVDSTPLDDVTDMSGSSWSMLTRHHHPDQVCKAQCQEHGHTYRNVCDLLNSDLHQKNISCVHRQVLLKSKIVLQSIWSQDWFYWNCDA